jgi:predicted amidohydrolase YtcJ
MRAPSTFLVLALSASVLVSCRGGAQPPAGAGAEATLYQNGDIITMEGADAAYAEAVVEQGGTIVFVGAREEAERRYAGARRFDLAGKTLMPGFIEPHLHPSLAAIMLQHDVIAPNDWDLPTGLKKGVQDPKGYLARITSSIKENAQPGKLYLIWGYHQLWHGELSRTMLNRIAGDQPVGIIHRSFHEIFLNDAAIALLGLSEADYKGNPQVNWAKGHFYEGGWLALVPKMAPVLLEPTGYLRGLGLMSELLQKNGITTIAEPGFPSSDFDGELKPLLQEMAKRPPYDVYLIPNGTQLYGMKGGNAEAMAFIATLDTVQAYNTPNVRFLPKQVKLFADGAIYSQLMQMKDGYTDGHAGEWMTPLDLLEQQVAMYWDNGYRVHVHANGDLGQQAVIDILKRQQARRPRTDHRFTLHHMGYFTPEMAGEMATLGMEASVNPYYLWALADKYAQYGLGKARAERLVAMKLLTDRQIPLSFHSDFSMAPAEPLLLAWTAVTRQTSQGSRFSQDQRLSVFDAMKAVTLDAARALSLEKELGSIAVGKAANFTILGQNPFKVAPDSIRDIPVEGIVYRGAHHPSTKGMPGGWAEAPVDAEVEKAVAFAVAEMKTPAKLARIVGARRQVVKGMNYDVTFELDNGETWHAVVYRDLTAQLSLTTPPARVEK